MNALIANFGNDSIGLIQYAYAQKLADVAVVSIDTGWQNPAWDMRVDAAKAWVESLGFEWIRLKPTLNFAELVRAQQEFPSTRFQWCAIYLKGDTCRAWLGETDPLKTATILLARRRAHSVKFQALPEFSDQHAEEFGDRKIWHPLYLHSDSALARLVADTPFAWLPHRSLECDPCVNSDAGDLLRLDEVSLERLSALEREMQTPFLPQLYAGETTIAAAYPHLKADAPHFLFDMGCGSPYGCGL